MAWHLDNASIAHKNNDRGDKQSSRLNGIISMMTVENKAILVVNWHQCGANHIATLSHRLAANCVSFRLSSLLWISQKTRQLFLWRMVNSVLHKQPTVAVYRPKNQEAGRYR